MPNQAVQPRRSRIFQATNRLLRSRMAQNSALLSIDALVAGVLTALFWFVAAKFASPAAVGLAYATVSAAALVALVARLGFDIALPFYYARYSDRPGYITSLLSTSMLAGIVGSAVFLSGIAVGVWVPQLAFLLTPVWLAGFSLLAITLVAINLFLGIGIVTDKILAVIGQDIVQNGGRLALLVLLGVVGLSRTPQLLVACSAISGIGSVLLGYRLLLPRIDKKAPFAIDYQILDAIWPYAAKNMGSRFLAFAPGYILPLIITEKLGPGSTAVFSVCWLILQGVSILHTSVNALLFAEASKDIGRLRARFPQLAHIVIGLQVLGITAIAALGKKLLGFFGVSYADAGYPLLLLLICSIGFLAMNDFYRTVRRVHNRISALYLMNGTNMLGSILLSLVFIKPFGLTGVGIAYILSQGTTFVISTIFDRLHPLRIGREKLLDAQA